MKAESSELAELVEINNVVPGGVAPEHKPRSGREVITF
jgi:hypothetical protein